MKTLISFGSFSDELTKIAKRDFSFNGGVSGGVHTGAPPPGQYPGTPIDLPRPPLAPLKPQGPAPRPPMDLGHAPTVARNPFSRAATSVTKAVPKASMGTLVASRLL
jgi:hypothetical protein